MNRIINYRPLLLIFLSLVFSIYCAQSFLIDNLTNAIIIIMTLFSIIVLKYRLYLLKSLLEFIKSKKVIIIIILISFLIGFGSLLLSVRNFESIKLNGEKYLITATLEDNLKITSNGLEVYLTNAKVTQNNETIDLDKRIKLNIYYNDELENYNFVKGNKIIFESEIYDYQLIKKNELNTYIYTNNLGYYSNISGTNIQIIDKDMPFDLKVRSNVKQLLDKYLSYDNSNMAYAVLFGDKTLLDNKIYDSFKVSGIAHLLAVSGLHVGLLVLIVLFILNNFKVNKKLSFIIIAILLFAYAYICGFSASVIRASIMTLILMLGNLIGERNDNLSSLSFAGLIILMFNPMSLFNIGFLLSMLSVFAIFTIYPKIVEFLKKFKFPSYLSAAIALTLSAQIGTLPVIAHYFNELSIMGIVTNIIALPLFTIGYVFLFDAVILTLILPFFSFLFIVPNLTFTLVYLIAKLVANLNFATVSIFSFGLIASVIYYLLLFVISNFVMLKAKAKRIVSSVLVFLIVFTIIIINMPANFNYYSVTKISGVENSALITTENNLKYLINVGEGDEWDLKNIKDFLNESKIDDLEALIVTNYYEDKQNTVTNLINKYNIKELYIQNNTNNTLLFALSNAIPTSTSLVLLNNGQNYVDNDLTITSHNLNDVGFALNIKLNNASVLFSAEKLSTQNFDVFSSLINNEVDILILDEVTLEMSNYFMEVEFVLSNKNMMPFKLSEVYDTNSFGNLQVRIDYDKLKLYY